MSNKVVKSVSFNIKNEKDKEFLEFINKMNFSGYVKDLIEQDLKRRKSEPVIISKTPNGGIRVIVSNTYLSTPKM